MWLTTREICAELHCSTALLRSLRRRNKIRYLRIGNQYRYELPKPTEAQAVPAIERLPLLTCRELADVLGITYISVRVGIFEKRFHPTVVGKRRYFTILELHRILAHREGRKGQDKQKSSRILVDWVRHYLERDDVPVQVLDTLLKQAVKLQEPAQSEAVSKLWKLFDQVNAILQQIARESRGIPR